MQKIILAILLLITVNSFSQSITMEFPAFAGKTYDLIIFQGNKNEKVIQDTIPTNGKFVLKIPEQYAPYTGMCRWLITGTAQGGGLDMAISGHDFSVTCLSDKPDNTNIVYKGFDPVNELKRINIEQQQILDKYAVVSQASVLYKDNRKLHKIFKKEKAKQKEAYNKFHLELKKKSYYNARFLPIVNLTKSIPPHLTDDENEKALQYNNFITKELSIEDLYVSGHWTTIISDWARYQANVVNDKDKFLEDFKQIINRINKPEQYADFVGKLSYYLEKLNRLDYTEAIEQTVLKSNKSNEYLESTQKYLKNMTGMQAPDLILFDHLEKPKDENHMVTILKSSEFAEDNADKTVLVFYSSACGPCKELMQQLPGIYKNLKKNGIDVIAISSDTDQELFKTTSQDFPWKHTYLELGGIKGINYTNYGIIGTPMLILIDKEGKIIAKPIWMDFLETWSEKN